MIAPRSVVKESIMPNYRWLIETPLQFNDIADRMRALKLVGVPYSVTQQEYEDNVKRFGEEVAKQLDITQAEANLTQQAISNNYDGITAEITEMEAMVAYLQVLGTMVDFKQFDDGYFATFR